VVIERFLGIVLLIELSGHRQRGVRVGYGDIQAPFILATKHISVVFSAWHGIFVACFLWMGILVAYICKNLLSV